MAETPTTALPQDIEAARIQFDQWRRTRSRVGRIPDDLWALAVKLSAAHGYYRTARALGLDSGKLKKLAQAPSSASIEGSQDPAPRKASRRKTPRRKASPRSPRATQPTFVELPPPSANLPSAGGPSDCLLELEGRSGSRLRIRLHAAKLEDVAALARQVWSTER